jgi:hypothetical protein
MKSIQMSTDIKKMNKLVRVETKSMKLRSHYCSIFKHTQTQSTSY